MTPLCSSQPLTSSQVSDSIVTNQNGFPGSPESQGSRSRPATLDRSTQTEPLTPDRVPLALTRAMQSLQLEDALPAGHPVVDGIRAKLHRVAGLEEEDEEQEDDEEGEQKKELGWVASVEEPIHPTTIRGVQREDLHDSTFSPEENVSASCGKDQSPASRPGPVSAVLEGEKKPLCVILPSSPSSPASSTSPLHAASLMTAWLFADESTFPQIPTCVTANPCAGAVVRPSRSGCVSSGKTGGAMTRSVVTFPRAFFSVRWSTERDA